MLISELDIRDTVFETLFDVTDMTDQTVEEFKATADSKLLVDSVNMLVDWKLHANVAEILNKYTPCTIRYCGGAPYKAVEAIPWKLGNPYWQQYYRIIWQCVADFNRDKQRLCELMTIASYASDQQTMEWIRSICMEHSAHINKSDGIFHINSGVREECDTMASITMAHVAATIEIGILGASDVTCPFIACAAAKDTTTASVKRITLDTTAYDVCPQLLSYQHDPIWPLIIEPAQSKQPEQNVIQKAVKSVAGITSDEIDVGALYTDYDSLMSVMPDCNFIIT